uniref:Chitin-binding type-2 domain-containing protein n=2 Tax=Anopheles atroparvus TaxID=41427 RepID=A0A182IYR9_ANOAO
LAGGGSLNKLTMSDTFVTACMLSLLVAIATAQDCARFDYTTFVADRSKCNYYTACVNRTGTPLICPPGYHFNAEKQLCDHPSQAGCVKCPAAGFVNVAVDGSCKKFIQCFMGNAIDRECPPGLLFDPKLGQCNLEARVKCN